MATIQYNVSLLSAYDIHLFREGKHFALWQKLGAHLTEHKGKKGVLFAVWAPSAKQVFVAGEFNDWDKTMYKLKVRDDESGIWEGFLPGIVVGDLYKFIIETQQGDILEKADPYAFKNESAPGTASIVYSDNYAWQDKAWMGSRHEINHEKAMSIYEVHVGSWGRNTDDDHSFYTYRQMAETLVPYVKDMGFTHVELMPIAEHPFYGSWGYQITGYFAPTSRYGTPDDLKYLIDIFHKNNISVILDWVPSHFPDDGQGLIYFDGTHLYEHEDKKKGFHPDWKSYIFNYGRYEVKEFLISNAIYWLQEFHIDALRVDAVASMLYLDYSRQEGEWIPNEYGGNENLEAIEFIKQFNLAVKDKFPDVITIAEESTAWPKVSHPVSEGGLGFDYKWMMGWMHDTINYFKREPIYRKYHQNDLTFSIMYAWSEHFILAFSHDEVVHGKSSLINKMPGDDWHKFANLRLLYGYMYTHPLPKMLFMGNEFAQTKEWNHDISLSWDLLKNNEKHTQMQRLVKDLNTLYKNETALYEYDFSEKGFDWIDIDNHDQCVLSFRRNGKKATDTLIVVMNADQNTLIAYEVGVPQKTHYVEVFNSDAGIYGGSDLLNSGLIPSFKTEKNNFKQHIKITIPPLSILVFKPVQKLRRPPKKK